MKDFAQKLKAQILDEFGKQDRKGIYAFTQKCMAYNSSELPTTYRGGGILLIALIKSRAVPSQASRQHLCSIQGLSFPTVILFSEPRILRR